MSAVQEDARRDKRALRMAARLAALDYVPRDCLACGKRIPRWEGGKQTTRLFCDSQCSAWHRRTHQKTRSEGKCTSRVVEAKDVPLSQPLAAPLSSEVGRPEFHPCKACGRMVRAALEFCSERCRAYIPLPPRKADGAWHIVAGPVPYCDECGLAIALGRGGILLPRPDLDGRHCSACATRSGPFLLGLGRARPLHETGASSAAT
jgi:hypothetical protein